MLSRGMNFAFPHLVTVDLKQLLNHQPQWQGMGEAQWDLLSSGGRLLRALKQHESALSAAPCSIQRVAPCRQPNCPLRGQLSLCVEQARNEHNRWVSVHPQCTLVRLKDQLKEIKHGGRGG